MGQVAKISIAGGLEPDPNAVAKQLDEVMRVLDSQVEFGEPGNPTDPGFTSPALLAGDMTALGMHNGTISNILGSWVEIVLEATGMSKVTCTHNLYLSNPQYTVPEAGTPNCRAIVFGVGHDGTGSNATSGIGVTYSFMGGDTVSGTAIDLRFNVTTVGTAVTIDATHPVRVTLFFTQATRGE
jgi:hypothetical protein